MIYILILAWITPYSSFYNFKKWLFIYTIPMQINKVSFSASFTFFTDKLETIAPLSSHEALLLNDLIRLLSFEENSNELTISTRCLFQILKSALLCNERVFWDQRSLDLHPKTEMVVEAYLEC